MVNFDTEPSRYRHWQLRVDGQVARLSLDVDEQGGLLPGYELKLNSYDLGVDIEFYDALQRLRFEHPQVRAVVVTSAKERMFCAGANIRMLAQSPHPWKVNFCKFTNETRNAIEDASACSGQTWIAALNGPAAGGGYEIALACDEILLVDDGSASVALPEVPLLGVLPATGGLTRMVDKRGVRRDLADVLATKTEGVRGRTAADWGLVDEVASPRQFEQALAARIADAIKRSTRPAEAKGIELTPLRRTTGPDAISYPHVGCEIDRELGIATITVTGPGAVPTSAEELHEQGADSWLLAVTRELDDLILRLRVNELEVGIWVRGPQGPGVVAAYDEFILSHRGDWLAEEILHYYKRTLKRLDVTSRSMFAVIEPGSCFTGSLAELALAADSSYMLDGPRPEDSAAGRAPATLRLDGMKTGPLPMANGLSRLEQQVLGARGPTRRRAEAGRRTARRSGGGGGRPGHVHLRRHRLGRGAAHRAGGAGLLQPGCADRHGGAAPVHRPGNGGDQDLGRLSAWQNWIFQRPNAAGSEGALRRYGTGRRPAYHRQKRV